MNNKLVLTSLLIALVTVTAFAASSFLPRDTVFAQGPAPQAATATLTRTRTDTSTPANTNTPTPTTKASGTPVKGTPTQTPFPAVNVGGLFVIEYDSEANTIYINPVKPGVKIVVGGYPLSVSSASTTETPAPGPTPAALTYDQLRGKIVFLSDSGGGYFLHSGKYFAINPDGTGLQALDYATTDALMAKLRPAEGLSPDHSKVVVGERNCKPVFGPCALYILDTKDDAALLNSSGDPSHGEWFLQRNKRAREPVWSPRGDYIAFVSNHESPVGCRNANNVFKGTTGQRPVFRRLTNFCSPNGTGQPSFSPDGSQLVYWSDYGTGTADLYVIDVGSDDTFDWHQAKPLRITGDAGNDWQPVWIK